MRIPQQLINEMLAHARSEYPNECCGLLAGTGEQVNKIYRMTNTDHSPMSYLMDPKEQFSVFKEIRQMGIELLAIYHSHTHSPAYPSQTDVRLAYYPDAIYIILSLTRMDDPDVKAYRIMEGKISEEHLEFFS